MKKYCLMFLLLGSLVACSDDQPLAEPTEDMATNEADNGPDFATSRDASAMPDGPDMDAIEPTCDELSVVSTSEPEEVSIATWIVSDGNGDSTLYEGLAEGTFALPQLGADAYGTVWRAHAEAEDGSLPAGAPRTPKFAATEIRLESAQTLFVRADGVSQIWFGGSVMPGDIYGFGDKRVPLALEAGRNIVVFSYNTRGASSVEFFSTPDAVYFNHEDVTFPDLRAGESVSMPLGVSTLNLRQKNSGPIQARVVGDENFEDSKVEYASIAAAAASQVGYQLIPLNDWQSSEEPVTVTLALDVCELGVSYQTEVRLDVVEPDENFRRTFTSPVDRSVQYYSVVPPSNFDAGREYALTLSLHGASVRAAGQARAYSQRDWTYVVAPTNRRRFGFDWEEWGRLNAINSLDDAIERFSIDETRVYLTGHSMGGHGTWHVGTLFPDRFAAVAPSAGWESFYSYSGRTRPSGPFGAARAASDTLEHLENLAQRGAYILHGSADRNVPVTEGRNMRDALLQYTSDVEYFEAEGEPHWWDGDVAEGTDCVDWPFIFDFFQARTVDPNELEFEFVTPGPWVSPSRSYATILSVDNPLERASLSSSLESNLLTLTTVNVRAIEIDGTALADLGVTSIEIDGDTHANDGTSFVVGPMDGKTKDLSGPFNQVFHRPFCLIYGDNPEYEAYASYLSTVWSLRGNGHACALPTVAVTDEVRAANNLVWIGAPPESYSGALSLEGEAIVLGQRSYPDAAGLTVFRRGDRLDAAIFVAPENAELLFGYSPFSSASGLPDYFVWDAAGGAAAGFYDADWSYDPSLGVSR